MLETAEIAEGVETDHLSVDEVRTMLRGLDRSSAAKIYKIAKWFAPRCRMPEDDLTQEAFKRMIEGGRRMPRNVDLIPFAAGVIKSIASQELDAIRRGLREVRPTPDGTNGPDTPDPSPSPERLLQSAHDEREILAAIDRLIEDDEQLQLLVEGICDGMRGDDLEKLLGVDEKGLAAVRKRLRRKLQSAFPKGPEL
uniref:sigma-70 family RNA polymerase sigma factor n=1 Tax=Altererythrobacter segetis TaxID=1104773 RepID=UPI0014087DDA|nr:sigma-70 family RNA polymerase sigma factor [Altererythrobacter segetis]